MIALRLHNGYPKLDTILNGIHVEVNSVGEVQSKEASGIYKRKYKRVREESSRLDDGEWHQLDLIINFQVIISGFHFSISLQYMNFQMRMTI